MHPPTATLAALLCCAVPSFAGQVIFNEVMYHPQGNKPEYIEVLNLTSNRIDTSQWKLSGGVDYTFPSFNPSATAAHFVNEYERIVLSGASEAATRAAYPNLPPNVRVFGPWTGSLDNSGETITLRDAAGSLQTTLSYGNGGHWPRSADGAGHSLQIINKDRNADDWRNWTAGKFTGGTPGYTDPAAAEEATINPEVSSGTTSTVTQFNDVAGTGSPSVPAAANPGDTQWKFYNGFAAPAAGWNGLGFNETGWGGPGYAPLGTENAAAPFIGIRTQVPQNVGGAVVTYYYRTTFNWTGPLTGNSFTIDQVLDDGAIYYLNGQEIGRDRMPNAEGHNNLADPTAVGDAVLETGRVFGGPVILDGKLVAGTNVIAASVHQNGASSSDHVFAARLKIVTAAPPGVALNEVKPGIAGNGFVEFYNPAGVPADLQNYYLSDNAANLTKYKITTPLVVPAGGYATIGYAESNLGLTSPVVVILTQPDGVTRQGHISSTMAIDGRSLGRKPAGSSNWYLFTGPTPGADNFSAAGGDASPVRLSEVHFTAGDTVDWVEVQNIGTTSVSGAGLYVSSLPDLSNKVAVGGTLAGGALVSVNLNFPTGGDVTLYLSDPSNNILATAEVEHRTGLPSVQAWPAGSSEWYASATATRDAPNNPARSTDIVINEIMFDPPSKHTSGEFIEITNRGAASVNLTGWRFTQGLDYDFTPGTLIAPGEFIVVAKDPAYITANYSGGVRVYGPADGKLGNSGDYIRLEDANQNLADVVDYKTGGNWPVESGGEGSSMELRHPDMDNSLPSSWRASNESAKAPFQTVTFTGVYKQLRGAPTVDTAYKELLLNLVGDGHIVLDNVSLTRAAAPATNVIVNGDATSHNGDGGSGFLCMGTHRLSDTIGGEFHLISQGGGDVKANKAEVDVTAIQQNDTLTFSCQARWVSGLPLLVVQTWDRSFGKVIRLSIPNNLGTPGAANSVAAPAAPPTVDNIRHAPPVPTPAQNVVVTARVTSATALSSVALRERMDTAAGNAAWNTVPMNDGGTAGDAVAGDGIWSATVAARPDNIITQFYVRATAVNGQVNDCPRDAEGVARVNGSVLAVYGRPAMWISENAPPSSQPGILTERYIFSQFDRDAMTTGTGFNAAYDWDFPRMSNFGLNATIIMNESDVLYNCELRKGGSPWTRTDANSMERARWKPPGDDLYRNRSKFAIDSDGSATNTVARFNNRIVRYMMYLFGYPIPDSEFVQQIVNGDTPGWREEMEMTDSDFFDRAYGSGGELFEIDDAWFMYDTGSHNDRLSADGVTAKWWLTDWSTTGTALNANPSDESPIYFHGNWPVRFPEANYDYASLSSFIKTVYNGNSGISNEPLFKEQVERMIDTDRSALYAAVRGYAGDWDNFTLNRGKNGYFYRRPTDGKFEFHHWDSDLAFQNTGEAFLGSIGGTGWSNLVARPWWRSRYNYYLTELVTKYTGGSARMNAWLTAMNYQSANPHTNAPFKTAAYNYPSTWFAVRDTNALNFVGAANYGRPFSITTVNNQTVATPVFALDGQASSYTNFVQIVGHPEAVFTWVPTAVNYGLWNLSGIRLTTGLNSLTVRAVDQDGIVLTTAPFNVTLSVNAPPAAVLTADPSSRRVAVNEPIVFDTTGSYDPEGTALAFNWTVTPSTGVTAGHSVPGKTEARFLVPGTYTVSVAITDAANAVSVISSEVTVFNANDFQSFAGGKPLGPQFTVQNVEVRDNFSASSWYSVEDISGRLMIQVLDDSAKPLASPAFTHPVITRDLPDAADFVLQTDLEPDTREFGNWQSGLWLEMVEAGTPVRYAFSLDGGLNVMVRRAAQPNAWTQAASVAVTGSGATLRIRRGGDSLIFQRLNGAVWSTVFTQPVAAGSVAGTGGVFVATPQPTTVRVSFDYLLISDPSATNSAVANLRITEIMYNPNGPGGIEFIELTNTGTQAINLAGVYFEEGKPFSQLTFPSYLLAPGGFVIVTNVTPAAFSAAYPATPPGSIFQWALGSLSNGGEEIILRDSFGNIIQHFSYDDDPLTNWPPAADGSGSSLEIVSTSGDYNSAANWSAGAETGGTPGWIGTGPDTDNDGYADRLEQIAGTDPASGAQYFNAASQTLPGGQKITWPSYPGRTYRIQTCPDLTSGNWTLRGTVAHAMGNPAGIGEFTVADPAPLTTGRTFYRVLVEMTP